MSLHRRTALRLGGSALVGALAGCLGQTDDRPGTDDTATTQPPTDQPTTETETPDTDDPAEFPRWDPSWSVVLGDGSRNVVGLDTFDGLLYATTSDDAFASGVAAITPGDGVRWSRTFEGSPIGWERVVTDRSVYVVSGTQAPGLGWSELYALDRETGETRWSERRERSFDVYGVVGDVVVANAREYNDETHSHAESFVGGTVVGLDVETGEERWRYDVSKPDSGVVAGDTALVVDGTELVALAGDGTERRRVDVGGPTNEPLVTDHGVYLTTDAGVRAHEPDGRTRWTKSLPRSAFHRVAGDNRVYVSSDGIYAIEADGSVAWHHEELGSARWAPPRNGHLYVGRSGKENDQYVESLSTADGSVEWTFDPDPPILNQVAATDELCLAEEAIEDILYGLRADDGSVRGRFQPGSTLFDVEPLDGTVYVADSTATVYELPP